MINWSNYNDDIRSWLRRWRLLLSMGLCAGKWLAGMCQALISLWLRFCCSLPRALRHSSPLQSGSGRASGVVMGNFPTGVWIDVTALRGSIECVKTLFSSINNWMRSLLSSNQFWWFRVVGPTVTEAAAETASLKIVQFPSTSDSSNSRAPACCLFIQPATVWHVRTRACIQVVTSRPFFSLAALEAVLWCWFWWSATLDAQNKVSATLMSCFAWRWRNPPDTNA